MSRSKLKCMECGVDMGSGSICPECGWTYAPDSAAQDSDDSIEIESANVPVANSPTRVAAALSAPSSEVTLAPVRSDAELWWEVLAVLAVGVIPHLAAVFYESSDTPRIYEFLGRGMHSASIAYVTLYLIYRSGEPWKRFGISRLHVSDVVLTVVLLYVARIVTQFYFAIVPATVAAIDPLPAARGPLELLLLIVDYFVSGFAEEIVTRAYLITRFEQLLKSRLKAVTLASCLFASYHLYQGWGGAFHALLFGLAFSGAFLLCRSIWPLSVSHALTNIYYELLAYGQ